MSIDVTGYKKALHELMHECLCQDKLYEAKGIAESLNLINSFEFESQRNYELKKGTSWTTKDDDLLLRLVGSNSWWDLTKKQRKEMAMELDRTEFGCRDRWVKLKGKSDAS